MEITLTVRCRNAEEAKEVADILSRKDVPGRAKDMAVDGGAGKAGDKAYEPKSDRTRRAYEALLKCHRVKLRNPEVIESWALAYPDVDLAAFVLGLDSWAITNEVTRSEKGWAKSCTSNLRIAQDKAGRAHLMGVSPSLRGADTKAAVPVDPAVDEWAKAAQE